MRLRVRFLATCVLLVFFPAAAGAADPVVELATLGGAEAQAEDVNDIGQIVGWSARAGGAVEATIWVGGVPRGLGLAPGTRYSVATAINNVGEVAGYSENGAVPHDPGNPRTATFWGFGGIVDIGALLRFDYSVAYDINDHGLVALRGGHPQPYGFSIGWVWSPSMGGVLAGADPIYRFGANFGINNLNHLVGYGAAGLDGAQAVLARFDGAHWAVGVEIGPQAVRAPAVANAISDGGIIVGQAGDGGVHVFEAARYTLDRDRPVVWLDKLDDFTDSTALDVNEAGLIVGNSLLYGELGIEQRAVVWVDEQIYDLNHLLRPGSRFRVLIDATGVNENGDVVGYGRLRSGEARAFLIERVGQGPTSGLLGHPKKLATLR